MHLNQGQYHGIVSRGIIGEQSEQNFLFYSPLPGGVCFGGEKTHSSLKLLLGWWRSPPSHPLIAILNDDDDDDRLIMNTYIARFYLRYGRCAEK